MTNRALSIFNKLRPLSVGFDDVFDHFGFPKPFICFPKCSPSRPKFPLGPKKGYMIAENRELFKRIAESWEANSVFPGDFLEIPRFTP